jgi:hypothetical protein
MQGILFQQRKDTDYCIDTKLKNANESGTQMRSGFWSIRTLNEAGEWGFRREKIQG